MNGASDMPPHNQRATSSGSQDIKKDLSTLPYLNFPYNVTARFGEGESWFMVTHRCPCRSVIWRSGSWLARINSSQIMSSSTGILPHNADLFFTAPEPLSITFRGYGTTIRNSNSWSYPLGFTNHDLLLCLLWNSVSSLDPSVETASHNTPQKSKPPITQAPPETPLQFFPLATISLPPAQSSQSRFVDQQDHDTPTHINSFKSGKMSVNSPNRGKKRRLRERVYLHRAGSATGGESEEIWGRRDDLAWADETIDEDITQNLLEWFTDLAVPSPTLR